MTITIDGREYADAFYITKYKPPFEKRGLIYMPLYTLRRKYLFLLPRQIVREVHTLNRELLGFDRVVPHPRCGPKPVGT